MVNHGDAASMLSNPPLANNNFHPVDYVIKSVQVSLAQVFCGGRYNNCSEGSGCAFLVWL